MYCIVHVFYFNACIVPQIKRKKENKRKKERKKECEVKIHDIQEPLIINEILKREFRYST